jgi:quercetin dioxygenase-like cupin family protein
MQREMPAIDLNQVICFEDEYPMAVPLETTLPGQLVLVVLRAGQSLPEHRVDAPATIQVLRGEGSITVAGTAYRAAAGTLVSLSIA